MITELDNILSQVKAELIKKSKTKDIKISELISKVQLNMANQVDSGHLRISTFNSYCYRLKSILNYLGNFMLSQISVETLEHYFSQRINKDSASISALHQEHILFGKLYNLAISNGFANTNKILKVPSFKNKTKSFNTSEFILTPRHVDNLISKATFYMKEIITVLYNTGMRKDELANLRKEDINLSERLIYIQSHLNGWKPKGSDRIIPMNQKVYDIISSKIFNIPKNQTFIFQSRTGNKSYHYHKSFNKLLKSFGYYKQIPVGVKKGVHFLRHSFCSYMINYVKVPLPIVQQIMGHSDIKTTMSYIHINHHDKIKAIKEFEDLSNVRT